MFEAKFSLKHRGCWTSGLKRFKSKFMTHNTISLTGDYVQDVLEVAKEAIVKGKKLIDDLME